MLCKEYGKVDCDQIELAFMQKHSLDDILSEGNRSKAP